MMSMNKIRRYADFDVIRLYKSKYTTCTRACSGDACELRIRKLNKSAISIDVSWGVLTPNITKMIDDDYR